MRATTIFLVCLCVAAVIGHRHGEDDHREHERGREGDHRGPRGEDRDHRGPHGPRPHGPHGHDGRRGHHQEKCDSLPAKYTTNCHFTGVGAEEYNFVRLASCSKPLSHELANGKEMSMSFCRPLSAVSKAKDSQICGDNSTNVCVSGVSYGQYTHMTVRETGHTNEASTLPSALEIKFDGGAECISNELSPRIERARTVLRLQCAWHHRFEVTSASVTGCELRVEALSRAACSVNASARWRQKHGMQPQPPRDDDDDDDEDDEELFLAVQLTSFLCTLFGCFVLFACCACCCACRRRAMAQRHANAYPGAASQQQQQQQQQAEAHAYMMVPLMQPVQEEEAYPAFLAQQQLQQQQYMYHQAMMQQYLNQQQGHYVPAQVGQTN